ncbi:MAG: PEGA domain-containing protein [Chitinivibrionales bacterium]|nr:PEGA domain-containing protein [Chitinivibrionales bacterium]MBD3397139.1 PEGA domain-containing protein [Chitinivibrionales bacterium]
MKAPQMLTAAACCIAALVLPAAAANEGALTVETTPEGIEVWLDDTYVGDSPIVGKKLQAGRYRVKLVDPVQHTSVVEDVLVQPDKVTVVEKTMEGKFGSLKVTSDPEGASAYLLTSLGTTPLSNDFMNPGKYRVELRHPSKRYATATEDVVVPRGKTVNLAKTLEKRSPFDLKAFIRLALGAGAVGGFAWAIVEHGRHDKWETMARPDVNPLAQTPSVQKAYEDDAHSAAVRRTVGIVLGSACVVGFEIVAFF